MAAAGAQFLLLLLLLLSVGAKCTFGVVYKVGDGAGWTVGAPNVSYKSWAASKTFLAGDTILFEYNKQFHNVLQVNQSDYRTCDGSSPIASHSSGNDSIQVKRKGHYFFICGFPGHCAGGQKVDIRVVSVVSPPVANPMPSPSPANTSKGVVPPSPAPANQSPRPAAGAAAFGLIATGLAVLLLETNG